MAGAPPPNNFYPGAGSFPGAPQFPGGMPPGTRPPFPMGPPGAPGPGGFPGSAPHPGPSMPRPPMPLAGQGPGPAPLPAPGMQPQAPRTGMQPPPGMQPAPGMQPPPGMPMGMMPRPPGMALPGPAPASGMAIPPPMSAGTLGSAPPSAGVPGGVAAAAGQQGPPGMMRPPGAPGAGPMGPGGMMMPPPGAPAPSAGASTAPGAPQGGFMPPPHPGGFPGPGQQPGGPGQAAFGAQPGGPAGGQYPGGVPGQRLGAPGTMMPGMMGQQGHPGPPIGPPGVLMGQQTQGLPGMMMGGPPMGGVLPPGAPAGPPGLPGAYPPGQYDPYGAQRMAEQFEALSVGAGAPGSADALDLNALPRPVGEAAAKALAPCPLRQPGCCHPDSMRMTTHAIPNTSSLRQRWSLPLGAVVHPMAEERYGREVDVVNLGSAGIVRCRRCRTYMNPFMEWIDGGRRFKCNVCAMLNEIPADYFCTLEASGRRRDADERPELSKGSVEYVAPAEYMVRPPMPPVYMFVIDVSQAAVACGMLGVVAATIKDCLDKLPGDERTLVGFLTFDSSLHFYSLKPGLTQPQMLVVTELDDPFVPAPDDLLVNLKDARGVVDALLDSLPTNFTSNQGVDSAMGPALQAAYLVMSHVGGKLLLFQAAQPSLGVGKLKSRENLAHYGTDRESVLRNPDDPFFKRYAAECSRQQISVDVFAFGSGYMDLASMATVPRFTCGEVYFYPQFNAPRDGRKLAAELSHNLRRPTAWEAVMRIRCSKGIRIAAFHGHFFNRSTDLLALPTCDPDKAFAVQIALEEAVMACPVGYVQCALLYTNSNGERRIRVHTLSVPVVSELSDLYRATDGAAVAALSAMLTVERSLTSKLEEARTSLHNRLVGALKEYRLANASIIRTPQKLIFPEQLRFLPLWTLGTLKSAALRGGGKDVNTDERIAVMHYIESAPTQALTLLAYPTVYAVHDPTAPWGLPADPASQQQHEGSGSNGTAGGVTLPPQVPASMGVLQESGAYLLDNGRVFVLWIGRSVHPQFCMEVFGMEPSALPTDSAALCVEPPRESPTSQRICRVLAALRAPRSLHAQCFVVRQGSPLEMHIAPYFVEDRGPGAQSYGDYLQALHKAVMAK